MKGPAGNPTAVGARVTLVHDDGRRQVAEVAAGGGYLSQSSSTLHFGLPGSSTPARIEVRWPDGSRSDYTEPLDHSPVTISHPG